MSEAKTVRQALRAIRWMLENVGWCQERFYLDANGKQLNSEIVLRGRVAPCKMCLSGAIQLVQVTKDVGQKTFGLIHKEIRSMGYTGTIDFNDHPKTTSEMVIGMLKAAEKKAKG